ncbi:SMC-Scp complex subunit ScpB [Lapidilactobacillus wuchangensis]|uniref:SMC-Scp complex subunit ScpB n=1 Tax=Lapidilactobacillus wuchangensis TaxID=2486001 RepID=UPI001CDC84DE|nr:SMC-Scp complex subunit ScpB [Lapidilactobacillus wuchangensis]
MIQYQGEIESILYTVGDQGISLHDLAAIIGIQASGLRQLLAKLQTSYEQGAGGLTIMNHGDHYQLVTKSQYAPLLHQYFAGHQPTSLSQAALETMAIVAYQQPVTRIEIDQIRGVKSNGAIQTLLARQLIKETGRKDAPGRPILYGTTSYFLDYFDLQKIAELPDISKFTDSAFDQSGNLDLFYKKQTTTQANNSQPETEKESQDDTTTGA